MMNRNRPGSIRVTIAVVFLATVLMAVSDLGAAQRGSGTGGGTGAGTGGGRGPVMVPPTSPPSVGRGNRTTRPSDTSPAGIALKNAQDRVKKLNKAVADLDKTAAKAMPKNLSTGEQTQWSDHGKWIRGVKARYATYAQSLDTATKGAGDQMDLLLALTELDERWVALQVTTQEESDKFTDLSKASKSRHDAAMKTINGIK